MNLGIGLEKLVGSESLDPENACSHLKIDSFPNETFRSHCELCHSGTRVGVPVRISSKNRSRRKTCVRRKSQPIPVTCRRPSLAALTLVMVLGAVSLAVSPTTAVSARQNQKRRTTSAPSSLKPSDATRSPTKRSTRSSTSSRTRRAQGPAAVDGTLSTTPVRLVPPGSTPPTPETGSTITPVDERASPLAVSASAPTNRGQDSPSAIGQPTGTTVRRDC